MKKLQNNFTTPEQSKRLLELGVPADSADCYYSAIDHYTHPVIWHVNVSKFWGTKCPCWSVGRLIEIFELCTGRQLIRRMDRPLVEDVKCRIAFYIHHHKFNFSKL